MVKTISILIVDDNIEFCNVLNEYLNQCADLSVKGIAMDGIEAIHMIKEQAPDVVILDLIMPQLDGIGVLERISEMQLLHKPMIIVLSAIGNDTFIQKALELGAEYYILKPFDINILLSRIRQLYSEKNDLKRENISVIRNGAEDVSGKENKSMEQIIACLISNMGIAPNIAGYRYLREAIILAVENPMVLKSVNRHIYQNIANKHNTTARNVDRAIRCAVSSVLKKNPNIEMGKWNELINLSGKGKSINIQMITLLTDKALIVMKPSE